MRDMPAAGPREDPVEALRRRFAPRSGERGAAAAEPGGGPDGRGGRRPWWEGEAWAEVAAQLAALGADDPYRLARSGRPAGRIRFADGRRCIAFCGYDYLGLNGHEEVLAAAEESARRYGTSCSASRLAGGECEVHRHLEEALAEFLGTEAAVVTVGGYVTNVAVLRFLLDRRDLVLHDSLAHHSLVEGCAVSGARRLVFRHNDIGHLEALLRAHGTGARQVLVVVESLYSMDGDIADLPRILDLKERHGFVLMVDEAHSVGTLGRSGRGLCEHWGVEPAAVDILMGTLSKSLVSCGGFIAGRRALVEVLRHRCPGLLLYSAGLPPPAAGAALGALRVLEREPGRVARLRARASLLRGRLQEAGCDVGACADGSPIVPVMLPERRDMRDVAVLSRELLHRGVHVVGLGYPVVPRDGARLRMFVSAAHAEADLERAAAVVAGAVAGARG